MSLNCLFSFSLIKDDFNEEHLTSSIENVSCSSKVHFSPHPHRAGRYYSPPSNETREQNQSSTRKKYTTKDSQTNVSEVESSRKCGSQVSKTILYSNSKYSHKIDARFRATLHPYLDPLTFSRAVPSHVCLSALSPICSRPSTSELSHSLLVEANSVSSPDSTQADRLDRDPNWPTPAEFPFADPQKEPPDYMSSALEIIGSLMTHTLRLEKAAAISRKLRIATRMRERGSEKTLQI